MDEDFQPFPLRASKESQGQFQRIDFSCFFAEDRARRIQGKQLGELVFLKKRDIKIIFLPRFALTFQKLDIFEVAGQIQAASFLEITGVIECFDRLADGFNGLYACPISSNGRASTDCFDELS